MSGKTTDFTRFPVRTCRWLHRCEKCGKDITDGQRYHDGGLDRRAHVECVVEQDIERGEVLATKPEPWIISKPGKMGGAPCVRGTRITVETLQSAAREWTALQILEQYPGLTAEGLAAALAYRLPAKRKGAKRT